MYFRDFCVCLLDNFSCAKALLCKVRYESLRLLNFMLEALFELRELL